MNLIDNAVELAIGAAIVYVFLIPMKLLLALSYIPFILMSLLISVPLKKFRFLRAHIKYDRRRTTQISVLKRVALAEYNHSLYNRLLAEEETRKEKLQDEMLRFLSIFALWAVFILGSSPNGNSFKFILSSLSQTVGERLYSEAFFYFLILATLLRLLSIYVFNELWRVNINAFLTRDEARRNVRLIKRLENTIGNGFGQSIGWHLSGQTKKF